MQHLRIISAWRWKMKNCLENVIIIYIIRQINYKFSALRRDGIAEGGRPAAELANLMAKLTDGHSSSSRRSQVPSTNSLRRDNATAAPTGETLRKNQIERLVGRSGRNYTFKNPKSEATKIPGSVENCSPSQWVIA